MRYFVIALAAIVTCFSTFPVSAIDVNLRGTIKNNTNQGLSGATLTLLKAGLTATSGNGGEFAVTGAIPEIGTKWSKNLKIPSTQKPVFNNGLLRFTIHAQPKQVRIDVFDIKGKYLGTALNNRLIEGSYAVSPLGMLKGPSTAMLYVIRIRIGAEISTFIAPRTGSRLTGTASTARTTPAADLPKFSAGAIDTMEVTLCGYLLLRQPVEGYSKSGMAMVMTQGTLDAPAERTIDSLFDRLRDLIGSLDSIDSVTQFKAKDFASIRDGFDGVLTSKDSYHMKASVGYIVSSVLALNTNASFWKLVDSLDAYISAVDNSSAAYLSKTVARPKGLLKKSLRSGGVTGLGKTLAAVSWSALALSSADPSFPKFITLSYIQSIAENDVIPVVANVLAACGRMESCGDRSLAIEIEGDTFEIDKGEIHLLDAQMRLLRAGLNAFCMYDMNIYSIGSDDYSWIDSLRHIESTSRYIYSLSGDTLKKVWMNNDVAAGSFAARLIKHNMQRAGFMTQRRAVGQMVKKDLLAVPATIKTGISYIRAETDNQSNDILKISDLMNADRDLVDVPQQMIDDGISPALANKFRTPESIADFVTELLSGPYTFNETTPDSFKINITVNLTAMLDAAVSDLRTLLPKYQWLPESEWEIRTEDYHSKWMTMQNEVYIYPGDSLAIPASKIMSIDSNSEFFTLVLLKSEYTCELSIDSTITVMPLCLLDGEGNKIDFEDIPDMVDAKTFFPYFNDYTLGGVFPGMTRQKWLDLIYQE